MEDDTFVPFTILHQHIAFVYSSHVEVVFLDRGRTRDIDVFLVFPIVPLYHVGRIDAVDHLIVKPLTNHEITLVITHVLTMPPWILSHLIWQRTQFVCSVAYNCAIHFFCVQLKKQSRRSEVVEHIGVFWLIFYRSENIKRLL